MRTTNSPDVVVIGQGFVGLPLAVLAAERGLRVVGLDKDRTKIVRLTRGESHSPDVDTSRIIAAMQSGNYFPSHDYKSAAGFSFAVITVPTPLTSEGLPDVSFIVEAGRCIGPLISPGSTVILESTTYPGTTDTVLVPLLEEESGLRAGSDFYVGYSPERIDPGNSRWTLANTPKVTSGSTAACSERVAGFYQSLGIPTIPVSGLREAEMSKLLENTFRHVNIALVNEMLQVSTSLELNFWESIEAASSKPFGFMRFTPGPGVGGHCLPIDPNFLAWAVKSASGSDVEFVRLANSINSGMPAFVFSRLKSIIETVGLDFPGLKVVLLGLAYKSNAPDTRESPALAISDLLGKAGAEVFGFDPLIPDHLWPGGIQRAEDCSDERFDAAVLVTSHDSVSYEEILRRVQFVLDTRNELSGSTAHRL